MPYWVALAFIYCLIGEYFPQYFTIISSMGKLCSGCQYWEYNAFCSQTNHLHLVILLYLGSSLIVVMRSLSTRCIYLNIYSNFFLHIIELISLKWKISIENQCKLLVWNFFKPMKIYNSKPWFQFGHGQIFSLCTTKFIGSYKNIVATSTKKCTN